MPQENNKRIAKNTLFLYFRMILIMGAALFTSRVLLKSLGTVDYGLNNVIAGTVVLFSFLNNSLAAATSRFITFELGKNNIDNVQKVFKTALLIHGVLALCVLLIGETVGFWLVNNVLSIPIERLQACNVVFQMVILSAICTIIQVPFNALIISHERMNIYAYIGIADALSKLLIAFAIMYSPHDRLILLSILQMIWTFGLLLFYVYYCRNQFVTVFVISVRYEKKYIKSMLSYTSWSMIGSLATMLKNQGINILMNIFFGSVVNAANAIAYQVNHAVMNFTNNFTMAMNPQIIKSYASGEKEAMKKLVERGGKFSFFLLLYLCLPIMFETKFLLTVWLGEYPDYTITFTHLVLILTMTETFIYTMSSAVQATGRIKIYQLVISGITLLNFPISFILFKLGMPPFAALTVSIGVSTITLFCRLYFLKSLLNIQPWDYIKNVFLRCLIVALLALPVPYIIASTIPDCLTRLIIITFAIFTINSILVLALGMDKGERNYIFNICRKFYMKHKL